MESGDGQVRGKNEEPSGTVPNDSLKGEALRYP